MRKHKKQECWSNLNFLFGKGTFSTDFGTSAIKISYFPAIYLYSSATVGSFTCVLVEGKTSSSSAYVSARDQIRLQNGFLRWVTWYFPDRLAAPVYLMPVKGCGGFFTKIGHEKLENTFCTVAIKSCSRSLSLTRQNDHTLPTYMKYSPQRVHK